MDSNITTYKGMTVTQIIVSIITWLGIIGILIFAIANCSGTQKPTVNMNNCTIVESPADGKITVQCDINSKDTQNIKENKNESQSK